MAISILQLRPLRRPFVLTAVAPPIETAQLNGCPTFAVAIDGNPAIGGKLTSTVTMGLTVDGSPAFGPILVGCVRLKNVETIT